MSIFQENAIFHQKYDFLAKKREKKSELSPLRVARGTFYYKKERFNL